MAHKKSLEALDRISRDLLGKPELIFGGVLILLVGDFGQTFPVFPRSTAAHELNACLKCLHLWRNVKTLTLTTNVRVQLQNDPPTAYFHFWKSLFFEWYTVNNELPISYKSKFLPLNQPDETTLRWLDEVKQSSTSIWLHLWHAVARTFLQFFMTQTDINGFLDRGSMFILSEQQFASLLLSGGFNTVQLNKIRFLDIGAGDGKITMRLINSLVNMKNDINIEAYATESSWTMRDRLRMKNLNVIDHIEEIQNVNLISCLNVLDRCYDPLEMLRNMHNVLAPDGRIIIALVLPYTHYVEFNSSHLPLRPLMTHWPTKAKQFSFEAEAVIFFETLERLGFKVESWTKAPYLCEGDYRQSFYWLIDLIVVLSKCNLNQVK